MPNHSQASAQLSLAPAVPRWRTWLRQSGARWSKPVGWVFWTAFFTIALFAQGRNYQRTHVHRPAWQSLVASLEGVLFYTWMGVVAWRLTSRYPIRRAQLGKSLGVHLLGAAAVLIPSRVFGELAEVTNLSLFDKPTMPLSRQVYLSIIIYVTLIAVMHLVKYALDTRRSEEATLRLKADLSDAARQRMEAELRALKAEVSPRFMIEAFDTVAALIATAPAKAEQSLAQLGDIVRSALHRGSVREVTLREELDGLKPFLELERARLGGALDVEIEKDRSVLDALVPDLILQPMVSTILKGHAVNGVRPRLAILALHDEHSAGVLEITVQAWGTRPAATEAPDFAGPANIQSRLVEMYGDAVRLELTEEGVSRKARLRLPWRDVDAADIQPEQHTATRSSSPSRKSQWMQAGAMAALTTAFYFLVKPILPSDVAFRRVYESSLPQLYFPLNNTLTGLMFTLTVFSAIEVNSRLSPPDGAWRSWPKLGTHAAVALLLSILRTFEAASTSIPYGIIADRSARHMAFLVSATILGVLATYTETVLLALLITAIARRLRARRDALRVNAEMNETVRRRTEAELRALQAELNPHFLGNALHTVSGLVRAAPDEAIRLLHELQLLLRFPMSRSGAHEVSLAEELEMLGPYLALERARFRRHLDVRWKVDQDALRGRLPQMILQPLVENAVKHGFVHQRNGDAGIIEVIARRVGARLEVAVSDDGVGVDPRIAAGGKRVRHVGVANTRARLRELYGELGTFDLTPREGGGTVARISVPWHEESVSPAAATYTPSRGEVMAIA
jgi:LytS/YehU family sensor histidine kinase